MRIALISYRFAPYNSIGAVRTTKLAEYWTMKGHDVRVIAADKQPLPATLPLRMPAERVEWTPWVNVNGIAEQVAGGRSRVQQAGYVTSRAWLSRLGEVYRNTFNFPDGQIGWYLPALRSGTKLLKEWKPEFIYASAMPFTSLLIARSLATKFGIPWVGELRDLWTQNHQYQRVPVRAQLEAWLEKRTLNDASLLVTVSEPLAQLLRGEFAPPVEVVLNGYDADDFSRSLSTPMENIPFDSDVLNIVHTGNLVRGRDPSPLFHAIQVLGGKGAKIHVHFFGRYLNSVADAASRYGIDSCVKVHGPVSHTEALNLQAASDIALLILENRPEERGVYSGKLFEYLGSGRPILMLGPEDGVAANLVRNRGAGVASNDPIHIASAIEAWMHQKSNHGKVPPLPTSTREGLTRSEQFTILDEALGRWVL